jgi:hypothetical protein
MSSRLEISPADFEAAMFDVVVDLYMSVTRKTMYSQIDNLFDVFETSQLLPTALYSYRGVNGSLGAGREANYSTI